MFFISGFGNWFVFWGSMHVRGSEEVGVAGRVRVRVRVRAKTNANVTNVIMFQN